MAAISTGGACGDSSSFEEDDGWGFEVVLEEVIGGGLKSRLVCSLA
jgi:hypothetical protein